MKISKDEVFLILMYVIAAAVLIVRWMKREMRTWTYVLIRSATTLVFFAVAMLFIALGVVFVTKAYTKTEGTTLIALALALAWLYEGLLLYLAIVLLSFSWWLAGLVVRSN